MYYLHTQRVPGKVMAVATACGLAVGLTPPGFLLRLALLGTLGAAAAVFRSLTVEVTESNINLRFGDGVVNKTFCREQVESARPMRTTPLNGWGIHRIGDGWLYNVYGLDAVEVRFKDGKRIVIGSDEPDELASAISAPRLLSDGHSP